MTVISGRRHITRGYIGGHGSLELCERHIKMCRRITASYVYAVGRHNIYIPDRLNGYRMADNTAKWWYEYHREDYARVKERLTACRNIMLHGRIDAAVRMLKMSCVNAVLSIQTARERHERAFTMHYAGDRSLKTACQETVYGYQKYEWLTYSLTNVNFDKCVTILRNEGPNKAHKYLEDRFKGLGFTKGAFALSMVGVWELACPDSRTKDVLGIDERTNTYDKYRSHIEQIDKHLQIDEPLFIKQWVLYDVREKEHARHMPFYVEVLPPLADNY